MAAGFLLGSSLSLYALFAVAKDVLRDSMHHRLALTAELTALTVDPLLHSRIQRAEQDGNADYEASVRPLRATLAASEDLYYVYTFRADGPEIRFVLDATPPGDRDDDGVEDHSGVGELYDAPDPAMLNAVATGSTQVTAEPYTDRWGTFVSAYSPIRTNQGAIEGFVGVDVEVSAYEARLAAMARAAQAGFGVAVLASALLGATILVLRRSGRRAELATESARRAAEAANRSKSEFVAKVSHELRTPISAIVGYVDVLRESSRTPSQRLEITPAEATNAIARNARSLLALVNDILDGARIEAGTLPVDRVPTNVRQVAMDVMEALLMRAEEKRLTLSADVESNVPHEIMSDPLRLRQIITNLVGNAIKFTESGSVLIRISNEEPALLAISVRDTGPGMTSEQMSKLFRPFTQLDNSMSRAFGGAGLGLSISRQLSGLLGGTIDLESSPGRGSVFTVRLPRVEPALESSHPSSPDTPHAVPTLSGLRILLAEDGADNARLIQHQLRTSGAQVTHVWNGESAVQALESASGNGDGKSEFDLILMDIQMPNLDGYGAASLIRSRGCTTPIVALTAHATDEDRRKCTEAGCDDYASKPLPKQALLDLCARWVRQPSKTRPSVAECRQ
jgi:signal transduction histidine kinase/CheY-like chemotaxis protein